MNFIKKLFKSDKKKLTVIGRIESVNLPEFELYDVDAKIDTGAYRGTIHADNIQETTLEDGRKILEFRIIDRNNPKHEKIFWTSTFKIKKVRSSHMTFEERYVIPVLIEIADRKIRTHLSLSDRDEFRYPILIGRKLLKKKFLVDVSKINTIN